jgi:hypothetical protein
MQKNIYPIAARKIWTSGFASGLKRVKIGECLISALLKNEIGF